MFKKVMFLLAILCLVSSTMFGCQTIKPQVAKGEVKPPLQIMSIPSTIEYSELVISAVIYPTERGTITGIDQLSIPEDVQVDIIKGEYVLLRTKYKNLGSSGEIKLIIDDKRISLEQFVFSENNSIETVRILKNLGMRAPNPVLSDSLIISLKKSIRSINTPLYFSDDGVHALLKNDIRITPSKHGLVNSGEIDLPAIPKEISILTDDWFHVNLEYFYNGKSYLKFTSDTARYLDKILITFEDGNFILTDLVLDNGMGKG